MKYVLIHNAYISKQSIMKVLASYRILMYIVLQKQ